MSFIYINVSGGIAEETATPDIQTLHIDWDDWRDGMAYTVEDLDNKIVEVKTKWPENFEPGYRNKILEDLLELRQDWLDAEDEDLRQQAKYDAKRLAQAKETLEAAGFQVELV
jgi:hypothetical protein